MSDRSDNNVPLASDPSSKQLSHFGEKDQMPPMRNPDGRVQGLEKAREASQARSHEEKSRASKKAAAHRNPDELQETLAKARQASQARSHEEKSLAAKKAAAHRDPQELRNTLARARAASQARSHEEKSLAAKKAAETRSTNRGKQENLQ